MKKMVKQSLQVPSPCWIYLDGTFHDLSNLCSVKDKARENGEQHPSKSRRKRRARRCKNKRSSPYTFVRVLLKSILSDEATRARQATDSQTSKTLHTRRNDSYMVGPLPVPQQICFSASVLTDGGCSTVSHSYPVSVESDDDLVSSRGADELSLCSKTVTRLDEEDSKYPLIDESPQDFVFRGAVETWEAFQRGHFALTTCMDCGDHMISVEDAAYVVCSHCRLVYPLVMRATTPQVGIGMGFKPKWCFALLLAQKHWPGSGNKV
jgi:hypothetical protein